MEYQTHSAVTRDGYGERFQLKVVALGPLPENTVNIFWVFLLIAAIGSDSFMALFLKFLPASRRLLRLSLWKRVSVSYLQCETIKKINKCF